MKKSAQIYLIRHGETIWNKENLLQGQKDIPLSDWGFQQAYEMSTYFKDKDLDFIGTSPLLRTQQTAHIFSKELNRPIKIFKQLKARYYGPWEGQSIKAIRQSNRELFLKLSRHSREENFCHSPLDSIESYHQVSNRVLKLLNQIEGNVLLITHGGVLTSLLLALKFDSQQVPLIDHKGYIKLRMEGDQLKIEDVQGLVESKKLICEESQKPIFIF